MRISLSMEIAAQVFAFLNRQQLLTVARTNKAMYQLVQREFSLAPYFIFGQLNYCSQKWECIDTKHRSYKKHFDEMPLYKYLRAKATFMVFEGNEDVMGILAIVSHIWESNFLRISWPSDFRPIGRLGSLLFTCSRLSIDGQSCISIISSPIRKNCCNLKLFDPFSGNDDVKMFSNDIVDFLYISSINGSPNLTIQTKGQFCVDIIQELINKIRTKFYAVTSPVQFQFTWQYNGNIEWSHMNFEMVNRGIQQRLVLNTSPSSISLKTVMIEKF